MPVFSREIFRLHGMPISIVSDCGAQFTSRFWRALCKSLEASLQFSLAYHPQFNGQSERTNQSLEQFPQVFVSVHQDDWVALLPLAEFAHNNHRNASTRESQFFIVFSKHPRLPLPIPCTPEIPALDAMQKSMDQIWSQAQTLVLQVADRRKRFADC